MHPICQLCKGPKTKQTGRFISKNKGPIVATRARFKLTDSSGNETLVCIGCLRSNKVKKVSDSTYLLLGAVACTLSKLIVKK